MTLVTYGYKHCRHQLQIQYNNSDYYTAILLLIINVIWYWVYCTEWSNFNFQYKVKRKYTKFQNVSRVIHKIIYEILTNSMNY